MINVKPGYVWYLNRKSIHLGWCFSSSNHKGQLKKTKYKYIKTDTKKRIYLEKILFDSQINKKKMHFLLALTLS